VAVGDRLGVIIVFLFLSTIANTRFDRWIQRLGFSPVVDPHCRRGRSGLAFLGRGLPAAAAVAFSPSIDRV